MRAGTANKLSQLWLLSSGPCSEPQWPGLPALVGSHRVESGRTHGLREQVCEDGLAEANLHVGVSVLGNYTEVSPCQSGDWYDVKG